MANLTAKTKKRKTANKTVKRPVRKSSQRKNPPEPVGTATEKVFTYWRTPRFKKDRAWLEEHLGQQRLFQYNPAIVRVEKVGTGYGVMIGSQLIGKPTTKAIAARRAAAMRATAKKFVASRARKNCAAASPKKAIAAANPQGKPLAWELGTSKDGEKFYTARVGGKVFALVDRSIYGEWFVSGVPFSPAKNKSGFKTLAAAKQYVAKHAAAKRNPTNAEFKRCRKILDDHKKEGQKIPITYNPSALHVVSITPGNYGVFLGKYRLKSGFKTKTAAELHMRSILNRRRNPDQGKVAAKVGREFLKAFDVDRSGELDKADLAILSHFNDPNVVIDDGGKKIGVIVLETTEGNAIVEWADGKTTTERKSTLLKQNGFKSWRLRRKAAYKKELKHGERAAAARKRRQSIEGKIKNPSGQHASKKFGAKVKEVTGQKNLNEFRLQLTKIQTKRITRADITRALNLGKAAGLSVADVRKLISNAYKKRVGEAKKARKNPGLLSVLAEIAMGTAAALDIGERIKKKPAKRKPAKPTAKAPVRKASQKSTKRKRPVRNLAAYSAFQGRPSTRVIQILTARGTPEKIWVLGRLWELRVKGYPDFDLRRGRFYLCADHGNRKLYIGGGPITDKVPGLPDGKRLPLGELTHVVYETEKAHLGDAPGDATPYIHRMGEETGERPVLAVDNEGYGHILGGAYEITPLGIRN